MKTEKPIHPHKPVEGVTVWTSGSRGCRYVCIDETIVDCWFEGILPGWTYNVPSGRLRAALPDGCNRARKPITKRERAALVRLRNKVRKYLATLKASKP